MYNITYSLCEDGYDSSQYYRDIALFTNEVLEEIENLTMEINKGYITYIGKKTTNKLHRDKYGLELLLLGVLWKVYSGDASGLEEIPAQLLSSLARFREQGGKLKPGIDFLRGIMATLFLSPDLYDNMFILDSSLEHLEKLLCWLEATGEFREEVKRLRNWQDYLLTLTYEGASNVIATSVTLAAWFEVRSEQVIGKYTSNVERYLNETRPTRYWHEDVIFCGRRRVEYHLNMVAAEVMNRAFREDFKAASEKLVILPACMSLLPPSKCQARTGNGMHCTSCTPECIVNKITRMGKEKGFEVIMVSHESSISASNNDNTFLTKGRGVVGVSCVLNLISGGLMLTRMGIHAQCVLLDYCGCTNHWLKQRQPTSLNLKQLEKIIGKD